MEKPCFHRKFLFVVLVGFFCCSLTLAQQEENSRNFEPNSWSKGLHFFAGVGSNASTFQSDSQREWLALGTNFKADIGWYFKKKWAIETSEIISFNRSKYYLFWNSLFTLGVRRLIEESTFGYSGLYGRAFVGYAPSVSYPENGELESENVDRIFYEGPAVGLGVGRLLSTPQGSVWFVDGTLSAQFIGKKNLIAMDGDVPVVISSTAINDNSIIYSFYLTIGILLF